MLNLPAKKIREVKYEDITVVTRGSLVRGTHLKELADITVEDIKDRKLVLKAICLMFKDFDGKIKVLK